MLGAVKGLPRRLRSSSPGQLTRSPWAVGPLAALWAAGIGLALAIVPMLIVWIANPASGLTWPEALRVGGLIWVVAQGTAVAIGPVTYSLVPWGLAIIPILLLGYAGGWAARRSAAGSVRDVAVIVGTAVATYSVIVGVVASNTARPTSFTPVWDAVVHGAVLALVSVGWGALRASSVSARDLMPALFIVVLRAGLAGGLAIVGAGALAAGVALTVKVDDAVTMAQSLHAGLWGGLGLLIVGLAFVPTMVVWATAYVLGAGFAIGPGVVVSPFVAVTAPTVLPPFPMLASIPQTASPAAWALPALGVVAGVVSGLMVSRQARTEARLTRLALALGAAAVVGALLFVLAFLTDGALGDVRLAHLGPSPTTVGVLAFVLATIGAVPSALVGRPPEKPQLAVAVVEPADEEIAPLDESTGSLDELSDGE